MLYICEAHATDTWPAGFSIEWETPKSLGQRMEYARVCAKELGLFDAGFEVYVDGMDNAFNSAFKSWPTCYYCFDSAGRLVHLGECDQLEASYDVKRTFAFVRRWLADNPDA